MVGQKERRKKGCSNYSAVLLQALESRLPAVCETNHDVIPGLVKKKTLTIAQGSSVLIWAKQMENLSAKAWM